MLFCNKMYMYIVTILVYFNVRRVAVINSYTKLSCAAFPTSTICNLKKLLLEY